MRLIPQGPKVRSSQPQGDPCRSTPAAEAARRERGRVRDHRPGEDFRARTTAADANTPPEEFAKTVVLWIDGGYALAMLPATHYVAPSRLARAIGAGHVRLASEFEMTDLLPSCEVGAAPPFGGLFELPTYASPLLAEEERITFNAGLIGTPCVAWADYKRLAQPRIEQLSHYEEESF